jgi:uncharacterized protein DUF4154
LEIGNAELIMLERSPTARFRITRTGFIPALCAFSLISLGLLLPAQAPQSQPEPEVKAAYLLNFGRFVHHTNPPASRASSFDICILGQDPIGHSIDEIAANESIDGVPVRVRHLPDVTESKACAIVFIGAKDSDELREDLAILSASDALTVGDAMDFLDRGGMIQFLIIQNRVRFAVNLNAVNRAHLVLSSELLRVACSVIGKPATGDLP